MTAAAGPAAAEPRRVVSLDQCADQFVLAFARRAEIAGVSHRSDDTDSELRSRAAGLPRVRASAEAVLAARPTVVVRSWGGDERLVRLLAREGVQVVQVEEANDFRGVEANTRRIAEAMGNRRGGEEAVRRLRTQLESAAGAWGGRPGLYMTPGGVTAGRGTLIDAILRAAGLTNAADGAGWRAVPSEALVLEPPSLTVLGFFDELSRQRWSPGRSGPVRRALERGAAARLPAARLGCPGWFAGDAAHSLAAAARRTSGP